MISLPQKRLKEDVLYRFFEDSQEECKHKERKEIARQMLNIAQII